MIAAQEASRVLVCGGRRYSNATFLFRTLDEWHAKLRFRELMEGGATGADALARKWGEKHPEIKLWQMRAKWSDLSHPDAVIRTRVNGGRYDAKAGYRRNRAMLEWGPHVVIAFDGGSGTGDMVRQAIDAGVWVIQVA